MCHVSHACNVTNVATATCHECPMHALRACHMLLKPLSMLNYRASHHRRRKHGYLVHSKPFRVTFLCNLRLSLVQHNEVAQSGHRPGCPLTSSVLNPCDTSARTQQNAPHATRAAKTGHIPVKPKSTIYPAHRMVPGTSMTARHNQAKGHHQMPLAQRFTSAGITPLTSNEVT